MAQYIIDSNYWINAAHHYPRDIFPTFWEEMKKLIEDDTVLIHEMVLNEIKRKEDMLGPWLTNDVKFKVLKVTTDGFAKHTDLCKWAQNNSQYTKAAVYDFEATNRADAWICAEAQSQGFCIVTDEKRSKSANIVKIPDVCDANNINCIPNFEFMRLHGFSF